MDILIADWSMYQSAFTGNPASFADKYNPNKYVVDLNFPAVAASGVAGVLLRVGISNIKDPCFDRYVAGLDGVNLPWGIYHAYDPTRSPTAQADLVAAWCPQTPRLGVFGDVEMGNATYDGANTYLQALDANFGRTAGLYSAAWYLGPHFSLAEQASWRGRRAWFAGYPNLVIPAGWVGQPREYDLHQFTDSGTLAGVPRKTDMNRLHPTLKLKDLLAPGATVAAPPVVTAPAGATVPTKVGLHGRADGRMQPADFQIVQDARIEAVKLMSTADPADVDRLRAIDPGMLIMVRCFVDFKNRLISAQEFAQTMAGDLAPFYAKGIRSFEVHNEPNLADEGLIMPGHVGTWADGAEFGQWFTTTVALLSQTFPDAVWGWPGLSPGPFMAGVRADSAQFLAQAGAAPRNADWIGMHAYWLNDAELETAIKSVQVMAGLFPGQRLYVTEFANVDKSNPPVAPAVRAKQYLKFYERLTQLRVAAAFSFVSSASNADFATQSWRNEAGTLSAIPAIVGTRQAPAKKWWNAWPEGGLTPPRRLASPPAPIEILQKNGQPLSPPVLRQNAMDAFERAGDLLRVTQTAINGKLWWVRASDVQPE